MNKKKNSTLKRNSILIGIITVIIGNLISFKAIEILREIIMDTRVVYPNPKFIIVYILFNILMIALASGISYKIMRLGKRKK